MLAANVAVATSQIASDLDRLPPFLSYVPFKIMHNAVSAPL